MLPPILRIRFGPGCITISSFEISVGEFQYIFQDPQLRKDILLDEQLDWPKKRDGKKLRKKMSQQSADDALKGC